VLDTVLRGCMVRPSSTTDEGDCPPPWRLAATAVRMTPDECTMDGDHFDRMVITFGRRVPRRSVVGLLSVLGLMGRGATSVAAQACLADGAPCGKGIAASCCSGVCGGKKATSKKGTCTPAPDPDPGICTVEVNVRTTGSPQCNAPDTPSCKCFVSRSGESFCGNDAIYCHNFGDGAGCTSDAQCVVRLADPVDPVGFPAGRPGDCCVPCGVNCAGTQLHGCVQQCANPATG
jgi:hypothetical protein